jgi:hypothetical protein
VSTTAFSRTESQLNAPPTIASSASLSSRSPPVTPLISFEFMFQFSALLAKATAALAKWEIKDMHDVALTRAVFIGWIFLVQTRGANVTNRRLLLASATLSPMLYIVRLRFTQEKRDVDSRRRRVHHCAQHVPKIVRKTALTPWTIYVRSY